ncbi:RICIN domain-containing protein [Streptomyces yaizuensis]|uniref:RICIN domain-containing protein n=1 Tax=Streptomyces yaizuensis TaxID=2989713 RepID=A0ABQ5NX90_9ACTN|nr:RICIN domain-containing protein [Streptomyces sp. YSPA8]GLF94982.1 RICIN domain-containing protein [Streptomyces sp. YSPA8]
MSRTIRAALAVGAGLALLVGTATTAQALLPGPVPPAGHPASPHPPGSAAEAAAAARKAAMMAREGVQAESAAATATIVELKVQHSGKCLDLDRGRADNGVKPWQSECVGSAAQRWRMVPIAAGTFQLRLATSTGKCLEVAKNSTASPAVVQQSPCSGGPQMRWRATLVDQPGNLFQLRPDHAEGLCLDIEGAGTGNGVSARQAKCTTSAAQLWRITPVA